MDGGGTFSPSVRVSEAPLDLARDTQPVISAITRGGGHPHPLLAGGPLRSDVVYSHFNFVGGHTAGLAASADGLFHPLWVDNRSGVSQIYTAALRVIDSTARRLRDSSTAGTARGTRTSGTPDSALRDISQAVTLELARARYVERDSIVQVTAVLRNTSRDTLRGPFELHIQSIKSDLGEIGESGAASSRVIVLAASRDALLAPGDRLSAQTLEFHLAHPPHGFTPTGNRTQLAGYGVTLVSLESNVFGRISTRGAAR